MSAVLHAPSSPQVALPNLQRYLKSTHILPDLKARTKPAALRELSSLLLEGLEVIDSRRFLSSLMQKEMRFGSAVECGVAIPHYRDDWVAQPTICLGLSCGGVDFGATSQPAHIIALIAWPYTHENVYLRTVGELAYWLRRPMPRQRLQEASTPAQVLACFAGVCT